ncbi:MAG: hypothetical protein MZW92_64735 [Comamonadaceae bacterium]|nr:hypothetical protein [Comamonadaceae bacterium]
MPCDQAGESCPLKASLRDRRSAPRAAPAPHAARRGARATWRPTPIRDDAGEVVFFVETMRSRAPRQRPAGGAGTGRARAGLQPHAGAADARRVRPRRRCCCWARPAPARNWRRG